jgi:H+-transporting ATPase
MEIKDTRDYEKITSEEVLQQLKVDKDKGLTPKEAKKRAAEYGFNEIPEKEVPLFKRIFKRFWGPIPWMIEAAAILSAIVKKWEDFTIIAILLFTNAFIDIWQESKAMNTLKIVMESSRKLRRKNLSRVILSE